MSPARRRVVLDPDFYPILATQLPLDRTATRPSIADFADDENPRIVRRFEDDGESQVPDPGEFVSIRHGEGWSASLRDVLARLAPAEQAEFECDELLRIERWSWSGGASSPPPGRHVLPRDLDQDLASGEEPATFHDSVQGRLLPNMDIEPKHLTIDRDHSPPSAG